MGRVKARISNTADVGQLAGLECEIIQCRELDADAEEYEYTVEALLNGKKIKAVLREYDIIV